MKGPSLIALALAFLSGLFFGEAFSFFPITLTCFVAGLVFLEAFFFKSRLLSLSVFCLWALGFLVHQFGALPQGPKALKYYADKGRHRVIAEVSAPPRYRKKQVSLHMKALAIRSETGADEFRPVDGRFQLFIRDKTEPLPFQYGDRLEMTVKLRRTNQYHNPGSFLYADYRERIGWQATARLSGFHQVKKTAEGGNALLKQVYGWREDIRKKILLSMDGATAAILLAMVIGESGYLEEELRETYIAAGIAHLLAVSGTHLAFISLFIFFCSRTLILCLPEKIFLKCTVQKIPSQWAALMTAFAVSFYALLAGGRIGTLRALVMILVYLFSIWLGRRRDAMTGLALAALLILFFQPSALFEISFQLSFSAVLSMILFLNWWQRTTAVPDSPEGLLTPLQSFRRRIRQSLRLLCLSGFSAAIGTAPLTLYYFHQFSWVGFLSNFLLTPIAGWLFIPFALLSAVIALFMPGFPLPQWHTVLWGTFHDIVRIFSGFPGADFRFASPPLALVALFYGSLFFLLVTQKSGKMLFATVAGFFAVFLLWGGIRLPPKVLRVTFLDVGQGDASLVEFPSGETLLVDGGNRRAGKYAVAPYLWQRRIREIDLLIVSHPQFDHMGGLPFILQKFKVKTVLTNGGGKPNKIRRSFQTAIEQSAVRTALIEPEPSVRKIAGCDLVFFPAFEGKGASRNALNNRSIVFRLHCLQKGAQPISFLFTGDIEAERERQLLARGVPLKSTVLKVPHHGSRSSSRAGFVSAVSPKIALVSVGRKNRYRHPHPSILETYEKAGVSTLRTDQVGAVVIQSGNKVKVRTFLGQYGRRIIWNKTIVRQERDNIVKMFSGLNGF